MASGMQMVAGIKTALFDGEGLFFAALRGLGFVLLQSLPFARRPRLMFRLRCGGT
jgi:uncharacterized protein (AIM24 family)